MLATMMTEEVVTAGKAFKVGASFDKAVVRDLGGGLPHVLPLMTNEVFGVEEPLATVRAFVRPLVTAKVSLDMTVQLTVAIKGFVTALHCTSKSILTRCMSACARRRR